MTLSWRRSAEGSAAGTGGAGRAAPRLTPQPEQNFAPGEFGVTHAAQVTGSAAPHSVQNRAPSPTVAWQVGHSIVTCYGMGHGLSVDPRGASVPFE